MTPAEIEADRKDGTPDHDRIWLEPNCADAEERNWCEDDVWGQCDECGTKPTEYIRADLHTARIAALEASLGNAAELVRALTGPDDSIAQAFIDEARALIGEKP